jgi:acetyl-CoA acetyltransferase
VDARGSSGERPKLMIQEEHWLIGTGQTSYSRRSGRSVEALALEASRAAVRDADISIREIEAVIPVGGSLFTEDTLAGLGLSPSMTHDLLPAPGGNAAISAIGHARTLLSGGQARNVLVVLARNGASQAKVEARVQSLPGQRFRRYLERPHGWSTPAQWYSMICRRHMYEYGTSKADLAAVALVSRRHAQLNPNAMMYGRPLTLREYQNAPMIADPYQLYDCCLETDGAVAVIVSSTKPKDKRGLRILSVASARPESPDDLTNRQDWFSIGLSTAAPRAYEEASVGPQDIDVALIYDCFTFELIHQLEEAMFCERGCGGRFVSSGAIELGGLLPVNPHGGLLSEGHLGGLNHLVEAVRQLRGEAGQRQVMGARLAAITGWGDWGDGSIAIIEKTEHVFSAG